MEKGVIRLRTAQDPPLTRKRQRGKDLKNTELCRHFDKPNGCPFENCKYAHGKTERVDNECTPSRQRELIRNQVQNRQSERYEDAPVVSFYARSGNMIDRYYTRMYANSIMGNKNQSHYVHMHSNRLCIVGLTKEHEIVKDQLTILKVDFNVGVKGSNLLDTKVRGKKKKGGVWLEPTSMLCRIECENGKEFDIYSCIRGSLIEPNAKLVDEPALITSHPDTRGYIAIIKPKITEISQVQSALLSQEEYLSCIENEERA